MSASSRALLGAQPRHDGICLSPSRSDATAVPLIADGRRGGHVEVGDAGEVGAIGIDLAA